VNQFFENHVVIGVHHRGTDKIIECPLVPYEKTCATIAQVIDNLFPSQRENLRIYVASDEEAFIDYISARFPSLVIYNNFVRSRDNTTPLHEYNSGYYESNYQMGREALIDCLLLSRCHVLIKPPTSCLSTTSIRFNPDMPVINL
jgi:hypothetical protein